MSTHAVLWSVVEFSPTLLASDSLHIDQDREIVPWFGASNVVPILALEDLFSAVLN
jgi:hypothetical protein